MDPRPRFREGMLSAGVTGMLAPLPRISTELGTLPSWLLYSKTGSKAKSPWAVEQDLQSTDIRDLSPWQQPSCTQIPLLVCNLECGQNLGCLTPSYFAMAQTRSGWWCRSGHQGQCHGGSCQESDGGDGGRGRPGLQLSSGSSFKESRQRFPVSEWVFGLRLAMRRFGRLTGSRHWGIITPVGVSEGQDRRHPSTEGSLGYGSHSRFAQTGGGRAPSQDIAPRSRGSACRRDLQAGDRSGNAQRRTAGGLS